MTGAEDAWTREAAHNRRRDGQPGFRPQRTRGVMLALGDGWIGAEPVLQLALPEPPRREEGSNASDG